MAVFGLPGGAEWLIILVMLLLLFVPGVLVFWFGYLTGKNAGLRDAEPTQTGKSPASLEDKND